MGVAPRLGQYYAEVSNSSDLNSLLVNPLILFSPTSSQEQLLSIDTGLRTCGWIERMAQVPREGTILGVLSFAVKAGFWRIPVVEKAVCDWSSHTFRRDPI